MGKLFSKIYTALRHEILSGQLLPGENLIEQSLADRFAVSRTPIREAIRQLQQEGLIESDNRHGIRVAVITIADAIHLYDCRLGLEQVAAMGACENATPPQLEALAYCLAQAQLAEPQPTAQYPQESAAASDNRLQIDRSFHHLIAEASGNPWLAQLLSQILNKMSLLGSTVTHRNPAVLEIWAEHQRIVDAIMAREPQVAAIAMRDHLIASKARVVQELQGLQSTAALGNLPISK
ncbi:MAG: GntR family transcriptional regulator [Leptolyngbya sp. SIOISBB]|nr:GntR family transcriptional regulator [Leptolyngbya sp. SIOISBB]